jgi:hypothetical protein
VRILCGASIFALLVLSSGSLYGQTPALPNFQPLGPRAQTCPFTVTISDDTPGAVLIVTTDGSQPFPVMTPTSNPSSVIVSTTTTFRALALSPNGSNQPSTYPSSAESDATYECSVWGFADLHTHPASHLAFGSDANGNNGLFWGKPADDGNLNVLTLSNDLEQCVPSSHNPGTYDQVQQTSDGTIISLIDATVKLYFNHQQNGFANGNSDFHSWPSALSVDHQQMDIKSLQRAYQGGLRLLFASVTNDEVINDLWNQKWNLFGNPPPVHDPYFDFHSALTQLTYIQQLVAANSSWMQVVTSPSQA